MPQKQPVQTVISRAGLRSLSIIALVLGGILLIISITQMFRPLSAPDYANARCGTVFTSDDDWTYRSTFSPDIDFGDYFSRGQDLMTDKVQELMDDAEVGSDAYDKCKDLHHDQWIIIGVTGIPGLILFLGGGCVFFRTRLRPQTVAPIVETWGSVNIPDLP